MIFIDFRAPNGIDFNRSWSILVDVDGFRSIVVDFRRFSSILGLQMGEEGGSIWVDFDRLYSILVDRGQF